MLRQSPPRLLVAFTCCCALYLTIGALPAAAFPGFEDSPASSFDADAGSWLAHLWRQVEEPVAALFAADGTGAPAPTPPTSNSGITIDPSGNPGN